MYYNGESVESEENKLSETIGSDKDMATTMRMAMDQKVSDGKEEHYIANDNSIEQQQQQQQRLPLLQQLPQHQQQHQQQQQMMVGSGATAGSPINLVNVIRHEIIDLISDRNFKHEIAQEMQLMVKNNGGPAALAHQVLEKSADFVKLDELNIIVDRLMSQNIIKMALERYNKTFDDALGCLKQTMDKQAKTNDIKINKLQEQLNQIEDRLGNMERLQQTNIRMEVAEALQNLDTRSPGMLNNLMMGNNDQQQQQPQQQQQRHYQQQQQQQQQRKTAGGGYDNEDRDNTMHSNPNADKRRAYNDLISHYKPFDKCEAAYGYEDSEMSTPNAKAARESKHQKELQEEKRVLAERRQFQTNMLMFRHSPFTMHLNSHKQYYPTEMCHNVQRQRHQEQQQQRHHRSRTTKHRHHSHKNATHPTVDQM